MATKTSFKQQCPHCEARVPIKDENMIGEEISCPKCKKPFVVEGPDSDGADSPRDELNGKAKARKVRGGDAADEGGAKKKKAGGSNKLYLGLGLAAVVVVLLVVTVIIMMSGDKKPTTQPVAGGTPGANPAITPAATGNPAAAAPVALSGTNTSAASTAVTTADPSNLLLNDTEYVVNIPMKEVLINKLGQLLVGDPSTSQIKTFEKHLGFPIDNVERLIIAANETKDWLFFIIRTREPINLETVKNALHVKPADPIQGQDYYITQHNWLENGSPLKNLAPGKPTKTQLLAPDSRKLAVRKVDGRTLVFADMVPMKEFLTLNGKPKVRQSAAATTEPAPPTGKPGGPPTAGSGPGSAPGGPPGGPPGGRPANAGPGMGAAPPTATAAAPSASASYTTIEPRLKAMLDRMEANPGYLVSYAMDFDPEGNKEGPIGFLFPQPIQTLGASLQMKDHVIGMLGWETYQTPDAGELKKSIKNDLDVLAKFFSNKNIYKFNIVVKVDQGGMGGPGGGGKGGTSAGIGNGPPGGGARPPGGMVPPPSGPPGMGPPGMGPPGAPGQPGQQQRKEKPLPDIIFNLGSKDKAVTLSVDLPVAEEFYNNVAEQIEPYAIISRGGVEMLLSHPIPHDLGLAGRKLEKDQGQFPSGIHRRPAPERGSDAFWPPDECVSWMADLLPYLGDEYSTIYEQIKFQKSWKADENLKPRISLVTSFLDGHSTPENWYIYYPGLNMEVAATHFVGMAGVGLDAAEYDPSKDASKRGKMGIFNYHRPIRLNELKDPSRTIYMIQVPTRFRTPWMAGGGSTIRGVPETKSIEPFITDTPHDGKAGTFVLMADGSVRFVDANIKDEVFKAMCVVKGTEKDEPLDEVAPIVPPPPGRADLKALGEDSTTGATPVEAPKPAPPPEPAKPVEKAGAKPEVKAPVPPPAKK